MRVFRNTKSYNQIIRNLESLNEIIIDYLDMPSKITWKALDAIQNKIYFLMKNQSCSNVVLSFGETQRRKTDGRISIQIHRANWKRITF